MKDLAEPANGSIRRLLSATKDKIDAPKGPIHVHPSVVFYDEGRPSSWIVGEWSQEIVDFFEEKGFVRLNASGLGEWIAKALDDGSANERVVVFSQDLIPDNLMASGTANDPIRAYLDAGGRLVWIGDIPFWKKSRPTGSKDGDGEDFGKYRTHHAMLYVEPMLAESSSKSTWMSGWEERLKSHWYSQRPINVEANASKTLYESHCGTLVEVLASAEVTLLPTAGNAFAGFSGNISWNERLQKEFSFDPLRLACGWHIVFNGHKDQGFYRLWDCRPTSPEPPRELLDDMLVLSTLSQHT